jgi:hypothetical protein
MVVVTAMMTVMRGLGERRGRYTEDQDEDESKLLHIDIVDGEMARGSPVDYEEASNRATLRASAYLSGNGMRCI